MTERTQWDEALDFIHGKEYTLDGVHGTLAVEDGRFGRRVWHRASEIGRESPEYRAIRRKLGDHYSSDLTESERVGEIMLELGFTFR